MTSDGFRIVSYTLVCIASRHKTAASSGSAEPKIHFPSKATKCLYFLKQLKRAGVPHAQLLHFHLAVIRPVLEYAAPVWHHSLNKSQKNQIEAIQKRAIRIIFSCTCDMPYTSALFVAGLEDLESCRDLLSHIFSNLFYYRHLVYIVYFRHLAILNYYLALGLPPNILEFLIELKNTSHSSPMPYPTTSSLVNFSVMTVHNDDVW